MQKGRVRGAAPAAPPPARRFAPGIPASGRDGLRPGPRPLRGLPYRSVSSKLVARVSSSSRSGVGFASTSPVMRRCSRPNTCAR